MPKLPHQSSVPPVDPQDVAIKSDGGAAESLQTTGADVVVSTAAPPTTGQILKATSPTTANWQEDNAGSALYPVSETSAEFFEGAANGLRITSTNATAGGLDMDGPAVTLEAWFKPSALGVPNRHCLIARGRTDGGTFGTTFTVADSDVVFKGRLSSGTITLTLARTLVVDEWVHYAVTRLTSTGNTVLYINGEAAISQVIGAGLEMNPENSSTVHFLVGADNLNDGDQAVGHIFEARKWSVERTPGEIKASYKSTLAGNEDGLDGYWRFDGDFTDSGPNGNTLAIQAFADQAPVIDIDAPFAQRSASSLESKGGIVAVDTAASPTAGQVLTAVDGVSAAWQSPAGGADNDAIHDNVAGEINAVTLKDTPVADDVLLIEDSADTFNKKKITLTDLLGGGGGSAQTLAAGGEYLVASMAGSPAIPALGSPFPFDTVLQSDGLTLVANQVTLKAGRRYRLAAAIRVINPTSEYQQYQFYDTVAAALVGSTGFNQEDNRSVNASSVPTAVAFMAPIVDTPMELRPVVHGGVGTMTGNLSYLEVTEIGAIQANVTGGLEFMDIIEVGANTTSVTFGEGGDGTYGRALDGDIDETYVIESYFPDPLASTSFELRPNGVTTDQLSARNYGGSSTGGDIHTGLFLVKDTASDWTIGSRAEFQAKSGKRRMLLGEYFQDNQSGSFRHAILMHGVWRDTSAVVTSLDIVSTAANAIKSGARFVLWRRTSNNLRADSAAVYERMAMETVDPTALETTERTVGHTIYGGSLIGVSARVEDAVTAGDITINVKIDGVSALTAVLDTANSISKVERAAIGVHKFSANKNISVEFVPTGYDNAGNIESAVTVQLHLTNDALISPPRNSQVESNLWYPPETAHEHDIEFDSANLPAGWVESFTRSVDSIDAYDTSLTTGDPRVLVNPPTRRSWYLIQMPSNNTSQYLHKNIGSLPSNFLAVARMKFNQNNSASVNNDATLGIVFAEDSAGSVDGSNQISILLNEQDAGTTQADFNSLVGGVFTSHATSTDIDQQPNALAYAALHKIGDTYHGWIGTETGNWIYLGSFTNSFSLVHVGFKLINNSAAAPGQMVVGSDFMRFYETDTFLF